MELFFFPFGLNEISDHQQDFENADGDKDPCQKLQKRGKALHEIYDGLYKSVSYGVHEIDLKVKCESKCQQYFPGKALLLPNKYFRFFRFEVDLENPVIVGVGNIKATLHLNHPRRFPQPRATFIVANDFG